MFEKMVPIYCCNLIKVVTVVFGKIAILCFDGFLLRPLFGDRGVTMSIFTYDA
jgi:hypothetical protein